MPFSPDVIDLAASALRATVDSLPEPASSTHVNVLTNSILRAVMAGERDIAVLRNDALIEVRSPPPFR